jgi:hypothetical protein
MGSFNARRALLLLFVTAVAAAGPGLEGVARPKKPPVAAAPPPPPPPAPAGPVGLPDHMIQDAAAYDGYMRRAAGISPTFTDAASVARALADVQAYSPKSLIRGAVAYGAIAALGSHAFVASLREAGNSPEHREQMVDYILANPAYLYGFKGSDEAAGLAREALGPAALRLYLTGKAVHQAAYDVQKQGWSKVQVADLAGRLAAAEAAATSRDMVPDPDRLAEARQSISGVAPLPTTATPLAPPYSPLVAHALQLAAIAALGEATEAASDRLSILTTEDDATSCLATAKRSFHECLAVAKPNYEDIFCTGLHGLRDTGACMVKAAGVELPPEPPPPPPPVTAAKKKIHKRVRHT